MKAKQVEFIFENYCLGKNEIKTLKSENEYEVLEWCKKNLKKMPDRVYHPSGYILINTFDYAVLG
jgi:hypothetical protein